MLFFIAGTSASLADNSLTRQYFNVNDTSAWNIEITDVLLKRNGDLFTVGADLDLQNFKLGGDKVSLFTPILRNGENSLALAPLGIYSHNRYIQYLRESKTPLGGEAEVSFRNSRRPQHFIFNESVEYEEWMNGATLYIQRYEYGCCNTLLSSDIIPLGKWFENIYTPAYIYETNIKAETEKLRQLSGRAYVDFPVNKIVIYPEYRNNTYELGKIIATIDSVKNDKDITVRSLSIAGTASPEGPYQNNVYLAKNRTIALKDYVRNLYNFPEDFIKTSYEPVDWKGLQEWLEGNNLQNKDQILAIVTSDMEPYARNSKIKSDYPEQYQWLLTNVYPSLRHSDYLIEYVIRTYSDIDEIREVINTTPQKLSLNEIYLLANSLEPGSEEYNEVFETAVRLYPNDETANLNAANIALQKNDLTSAKKYLDKAGDSDLANYARGIYVMKTGDFNKALEIFSSLRDSLPAASDAIDNIVEIINFGN